MKHYICSVTHLNLQNENGPTLHVRGIADGFFQLGIKVDLITSGSNQEFLYGGESIILADRQPATPLEHLRFQLNTFRFLARRRGKYDWIYVRAGSFMLAPLYGVIAGAPVALEVNGIPDLEGKFSFPLRTLIRFLFRWQVKGARLCLAVTPELCAFVSQLGQKHVYAIPNGVDNRTVNAASQSIHLRKDRHNLHLVFVGALHAWQGVHLAVNAVEELVRRGLSVKFDILGDGPELKPLNELVTALNLQEKIYFHGHASRETVYEFLSNADVAVAPFVLDERNQTVGGLSPLKIYEYLAFNLPVVTTSLLSDDELLRALPGSVTIAPSDVQSISDAIIKSVGNASMQNLPGRWIAHNRTWTAAARRSAAAMKLEVQ